MRNGQPSPRESRRGDTPGESEWYVVAAETSVFWHRGDQVEVGQILGRTSAEGDPVRAGAVGRVVGIQYDVETSAIILTVEPV